MKGYMKGYYSREKHPSGENPFTISYNSVVRIYIFL